MSDQEDFESYMQDNEDLDPEKFFKMVTVMPQRKVKMTAFLEDKDGTRIDLSTIAKNLKDYIEKHMTSTENSPVNTQLFPLINQMMVASVPRHVGIPLSYFLFSARESRYALSTFGLQISLMMRYIQQHELKIVTEETPITDRELEEYFSKEAEADQKLREALGRKSNDEFEDN